MQQELIQGPTNRLIPLRIRLRKDLLHLFTQAPHQSLEPQITPSQSLYDNLLHVAPMRRTRRQAHRIRRLARRNLLAEGRRLQVQELDVLGTVLPEADEREEGGTAAGGVRDGHGVVAGQAADAAEGFGGVRAREEIETVGWVWDGFCAYLGHVADVLAEVDEVAADLLCF